MGYLDLAKVKVKVHPITCHECPEGEYRYSPTLSWPWHLDRGWVVSTTPRPLYLRERPGTHCTGGWVVSRAGLDGCGNSRLPPGFDPRTVQPVASRYTDWAIPAPTWTWLYYEFSQRRTRASEPFATSPPPAPTSLLTYRLQTVS